MLYFIIAVSASRLGITYAFPPKYGETYDLVSILIKSITFIIIGIASILNWGKYNDFKLNCICSYTIILLLTHHSITETLFRVFPILVIIIVFLGLVILNVREQYLKFNTIIALSYLIGCNIAVTFNALGIVNIIFPFMFGLLIAMLINHLNFHQKSALEVLFTGWILFILLDIITKNNISDLLDKNTFVYTLPIRLLLIISNVFSIFLFTYKEKIYATQAKTVATIDDKIENNL